MVRSIVLWVLAGATHGLLLIILADRSDVFLQLARFLVLTPIRHALEFGGSGLQLYEKTRLGRMRGPKAAGGRCNSDRWTELGRCAKAAGGLFF